MTKKSCLGETNIGEMIWGDGGETTRDAGGGGGGGGGLLGETTKSENRGEATRLETFGFRYVLLPNKVHR